MGSIRFSLDDLHEEMERLRATYMDHKRTDEQGIYDARAAIFCKAGLPEDILAGESLFFTGEESVSLAIYLLGHVFDAPLSVVSRTLGYVVTDQDLVRAKKLVQDMMLRRYEPLHICLEDFFTFVLEVRNIRGAAVGHLGGV